MCRAPFALTFSEFRRVGSLREGEGQAQRRPEFW